MDSADRGEGPAGAAAVRPAAYAVRNLMDMPEALLTILLENMFRSGKLTHSDRAALQCVNKCLHRLCSAQGSFHVLRPSSRNLFDLLQQVAHGRAAVDGLMTRGAGIGDASQPLCMALAGLAAAPIAAGLRALHIDTLTGRLHGAALGSLWGLRSLQALTIHSAYPVSNYHGDYLSMALDHLTGLTSLDVRVQLPIASDDYGDAANRWTSDVNIINEVCGFPRSLVKCACLRRLSLRWTDSGLVYPSDVPANFGNLTALENVQLEGCEVASLPATITRLTRLTSLKIMNNGWELRTEDVLLPETFPTAMQTLQHIDIKWRGNDKQLVYDDPGQVRW